jgi:AraC-like DNA-binding protein
MTAVTGVLREQVLVERYRYEPGPGTVLPRHTHAQYQLNLSLGEAGGVYHRGAYTVVGPGELAVIMPGEAHTPRDPDRRTRPSVHFTLYVEPGRLEAVRERAGLPAFPDLVVRGPRVAADFLALHRVLSGPSWRLDQDVCLVSFLGDLVERADAGGVGRAERPAHRAVGRAVEYLRDNPALDVSLAELARVTGSSPFRLARLFAATVGVPPHAYHVQVRIDHAKRLLLAGWSATDTAHASGFFDLSHFTRHFRRSVGVSPGTYAGTPRR